MRLPLLVPAEYPHAVRRKLSINARVVPTMAGHQRQMAAERDLGDAERWRRPDGVDDATVAAVAKVSEGLECVHRIRGAIYDAHQLTGKADYLFEDAAKLLRDAGHTELAELVARDLVGRNLLPGRWTFQITEEFDDTYYYPAVDIEARVRQELVAGRRHIYESELKRERRTPGRPGHEERPADLR